MRYGRPINLSQILAVAFYALLAVCIATDSSAEDVENSQLFVIQVDGTGLVQLTDQLDWGFGSPQWSPDGRRIALDGWSIEGFEKGGYSTTHLFVMNADGSKRKDIGMGAMPDWSPDGQQLVFHTYYPSAIAVSNTDGTGREQVAGHWGCPRWSSNAKHIISLARGHFGVLDLSTGVEKLMRVPRGYGPGLGFSISPDGSQICFTARSNGRLAVATIDASGKCKSVQQLVGDMQCQFTSWSPDGTQVAFTAQTSATAKMQVYLIRNAPNEKPQALPGQPVNASNSSPDWSPDGKRIVFASDATD